MTVPTDGKELAIVKNKNLYIRLIITKHWFKWNPVFILQVWPPQLIGLAWSCNWVRFSVALNHRNKQWAILGQKSLRPMLYTVAGEVNPQIKSSSDESFVNHWWLWSVTVQPKLNINLTFLKAHFVKFEYSFCLIFKLVQCLQIRATYDLAEAMVR